MGHLDPSLFLNSLGFYQLYVWKSHRSLGCQSSSSTSRQGSSVICCCIGPGLWKPGVSVLDLAKEHRDYECALPCTQLHAGPEDLLTGILFSHPLSPADFIFRHSLMEFRGWPWTPDTPVSIPQVLGFQAGTCPASLIPENLTLEQLTVVPSLLAPVTSSLNS